MHVLGGIWLAAALAAGAAGGAGAPPASSPAAAAARDILAGGDGARRGGPYQTDLPGDGAHSPAGGGKASPGGDAAQPPYQTELPDHGAPPAPSTLSLGPLAALLRILGWVALGIVALLVAVALGRALQGWLRGRRARDVAAAGDPLAAVPVAIPIGDAEALAARGDYAGAVHALLLRTLEALSRAARLSPALTSREIVARVPLAPRARLALRGLVHAVEVSRFGGAEPGEAEYLACLERFREFVDTAGAAA